MQNFKNRRVPKALLKTGTESPPVMVCTTKSREFGLPRRMGSSVYYLSGDYHTHESYTYTVMAIQRIRFDEPQQPYSIATATAAEEATERIHVATYDNTTDIVMEAIASKFMEPEVTPRESNVDRLELIGLDVTKFQRDSFSLFDWRNIVSLSFESCWGLEQFFAILAPSTDSRGSFVKLDVRLRSFRVRVENSSHGFRNQLCDFLMTLPGLSNLAVLLEYNSSLRRTSKFKKVLSTHGKTLKSLVWDERKRTRNSFSGQDGRFPCSEQILDITDLCKELVELGVPLDWQMFATSGSPIDARVKRRLRSMKYLRTLNIRTMPSLDPMTSMLPQWENMHSHFADTVIKTILDTQDLGCRPPLDTLAIGALRYRDVRNGLGCRTVYEPEMYKYYRLQVYDIDRRYKNEGRYKPLAIPREVGTYEKTEAAGRCVEVLRPYWFG
ncbi:MAG: hypothetical protein Q9213_001333 [Squamulea squamosa]